MEAEDDQENNGSSGRVDPPSSSCSSKLKVKLKMSKLVKDEDKVDNVVVVVAGRDEDVCEEKINLMSSSMSKNNYKKEHICSECGKEFSSGKALGGHMSSAHVQANQRLEESWKKKTKKTKNFNQDKSRRFDEEEEDEEEEEEDGVFDDNNNNNHHEMRITCDLCDKKFPSKKSLFGHMRCHPDRDWRGMKPPNKKKIAENGGFRANFHEDEDEDEDEDVGFDDGIRGTIDVNDVVDPPRPLNVDLKDCLKSWGVKDRRGRSPLGKRRISTSSDDKELHDAVHQLMRLVNGDNNNINNNNNNSEVICSSNSVGSSAPKDALINSLKDKPKRKAILDNTEEQNSPVHKKRKREKELIKLEPPAGGKDLVLLSPSPGVTIKKTPPPPADVKYKCNICGKVFASHQALGGHRSSHNKFKITIENTIDHHQDQEIKARNQENHHQDVQLGGGDQEINNVHHKCKICDKIFPTGQALGGHQRSHWTNNQDESSSSQNPSKVLDFDLNEVPELDDDYYR